MDASRAKSWKIDPSLRRILKWVQPDYRISLAARKTVSDLLWMVFRKLMRAANVIKGEQKTLTSKKIQMAAQLVFSKTLTKYIVNDGNRAVQTFDRSPKKNKGKRARIKANLSFSVSAVRNSIRDRSTYEKLGAKASVYMAGAFEFVATEMLELAGNAARERRKITIQAKDIYSAILYDEELRRLFQAVTIEAGLTSSPLFKGLKDGSRSS